MIVRQTAAADDGDILKIIKSSGCHKMSFDILHKKMSSRIIIIDDIDNRAANILKQEALSCGAEAAVDENVSRFKTGFSRVVLSANISRIEKLSLKLEQQPFGLKELAVSLKNIIRQNKIKTVICGSRKIMTGGKTLVMAIVNLSSDSFYGDGSCDEKTVIEKVLQAQKDGADIIDIGAESTRPGSKPVCEKEEAKIIKRFLKILRKKTDLPISVDTYKTEAVKAAVGEGADIINDIYALGYDKRIAGVIAKNKTGVILMHMKGTPLTMQKKAQYKDVMRDIYGFLSDRAGFALQNGINEKSIMIDPGVGFGKTVGNNLEIIKKIAEFKTMGFPVVAGLSNKSFLGKIIESGEVHERFSANIAANIIAASNGADIVRVHNVKEIVQALKFFDAVRSV